MYPEPLLERYDGMWQRAIPLIREGDVEIDPRLASNTPDQRRGFTLIARLGDEVQNRVLNFLETLKRIDPDQYYYQATELHLTVLSLFTATEDHTLFEPARFRFEEVLGKTLRELPAFEIEFRGITASPAAVIIQGFPKDSTLETIRKQLRAALRSNGLGEGLDQRYRLVTAHVTGVRFRAPLKITETYAEILARGRAENFGVSRIIELQLVRSDWFMSHNSQKLLAAFALRPGG